MRFAADGLTLADDQRWMSIVIQDLPSPGVSQVAGDCGNILSNCLQMMEPQFKAVGVKFYYRKVIP